MDYKAIITALRKAEKAPRGVATCSTQFCGMVADAIEDLQKEYEILAKMYDKANEELTELRAAQHWISVEDAMPELIPTKAGTAYSEAVVVLTSGRKILTAVFDGEDFICDWQFWECDSDEVITHWKSVLPLPEPPEVEDGT